MAALLLGCPSNRYTPPTEGPSATIVVSSSCTRRASFFARINRQRTETHGCNETARWPVLPGQVQLVIQVEEAEYQIEPLSIEFELEADQCASFLLRQREGYDLEFFGVGPCD